MESDPSTSKICSAASSKGDSEIAINATARKSCPVVTTVSTISMVCRICYNEDTSEAIITPCCCKGTMAFIHQSCLEKWLAESNSSVCELCHQPFNTQRTPKYSAPYSIWRWCRHQPMDVGFQIRALRSDILACTILTPLAILVTYVCLFSADYYNQKKFAKIPVARWTSISLLIMIGIMLLGYYLWVYMVIKYHGRVWYYWWQKECIVRIVPVERNDLNDAELEETTQV